MHDVDIVCVDDDAFGYATFQSHNQKVVENRNGIFITHLKKRLNEAYTAQRWRLSRSTDGGRTFVTLWEAVDATNAPVLETDAADNLYLIRADFCGSAGWGDAYLYRFSPEDDYSKPEQTRLQGGGSAKFSMVPDAVRGQLYYAAHDNTFHVIGLDGVERRSIQITQPGEIAELEYPHLSLDQDGILHFAWTSEKHGPYHYQDIRYMRSRDGGDTWETMDGTAVALPVKADSNGPTDRITLDDEDDEHTWLASFMARSGKLHFIYQYSWDLQENRQHYVRYDIATGKRDRDVWPEFKGEHISLNHFDGFFATRAENPDTPLYCIMASEGRIACLISRDNGDTWQDHALSSRRFVTAPSPSNPYAIGGCRELTADGAIIGTFTDRNPVAGKKPESLIGVGTSAPAYFFRIESE
ncbi:MAG: BNR-4 repeat-containing protein [Planctomycetota bacterium]|nr:BNR-4 repeat-containing protein [Planctomycetota bacterium]